MCGQVSSVQLQPWPTQARRGNDKQRPIGFRQRTIIRQPVDTADATKRPFDGGPLRRLERVERIALTRTNRSPSAQGQPRLDALANDNLMTLGGWMMDTVMRRLSLGAGRRKNKSERGGSCKTDWM
jgi:hypothetical protein